MSRFDKMFNDAINHSDKRMALELLIEKYRPKPIKTYKENGLIITVYESH